MNPPFERTVCACTECVACCKQQPGFLIPGDIQRIAEFLGAPVQEFLWASPGAKAMDTRTGRVFSIPTITPRMKDGRCAFLDENDRCKIHPVAPFGCAYADTHMSLEHGQRISVWAMREVMESGAYQEFRSHLPAATSYKPRMAL